MQPFSVVVLTVALGIISDVSSAAIVAYTNKSDWSSAALGGYFTETFDNFSAATYGSAQLSSGITITTGPGLHGSLTQVQYSGVSRWHDSTSASGDTTVFDFHRPVTAVGGDWDLTSFWIGTPNPLRIYLDDHLANQMVTNTQFLGLFSTVPFSKMTVVYGGTNNSYQNWDIDNLTVSPVPEPGAGLLAAIGVVGIAAFRARRSQFVTDNQKR